MLYDEILRKIMQKSVVVGIVGLGYVGLPLAVSFAKNGIKVVGFEKSINKLKLLNEGVNYIADISEEEFRKVYNSNKIQTTDDFQKINECDATIICVPTPLDRFKKPDMSYIEKALIEIGRNMKKGTFISLESTTYPTTTEEFMKPILERESGMLEGRDFWICFSPERVDPGNLKYKTENTPKVIGAIGEEAKNIAVALYSIAIENIYTVSSPKVAEMVKILENTYRLINISLINEIALLAGRMNIDIWEVIEAAKTKPYGFQAFYPGPGIGGHCIPLDPFYLEYIAKGHNFDLTMIDAAGRINNLMPYRIMNKIAFALNRQKKSMNGSLILFLGVAYKANINDARESPAIEIMKLVEHKGAIVLYNDPYIPEIVTEIGNKWESIQLTDEMITKADCVVFTTNHSCYDVNRIVSLAKLVVDTRNAVKDVSIENEKVFKL